VSGGEVQIRAGASRGVARPAVVLDANALMLPFQFRINLDAELARILGTCDVYVPSPVVHELERIAAKDRKARGALELAARYRTYDTDRPGDLAVLAAAEALNAVVVTNDRGLLAALRARGIPRIRLRSKTHLELET